jgi:hypothetical protein
VERGGPIQTASTARGADRLSVIRTLTSTRQNESKSNQLAATRRQKQFVVVVVAAVVELTFLTIGIPTNFRN